MRLTGFLAVLLFLAIVFFAAPAASYAQTADVTHSSQNATADDMKSQFLPPQAHLSRRMFSEDRQDGVCYTMRTYIVARESRDSDVTYPKGYRECLPEWKLQMRSADAPAPGGNTP